MYQYETLWQHHSSTEAHVRPSLKALLLPHPAMLPLSPTCLEAHLGLDSAATW